MTTPSTDTPTHLPPQNLEAEEAILGAMMLSQTAIERANDAGLKREDFYRESHQVIFDVIQSLADRGNVDELLVVDELRQRKKIVSVGGSASVVSLTTLVPAVANAKAYAQEVVDQATLRQLVQVGHEIARLGYEHPETPSQLVVHAGALVDTLADRRGVGSVGFTTLSDAMADAYAHLEERAARGQAMVGIPTGLHVLDERWGGLPDGKLIILAGRPGMGKSGLMGSIAENIVLGAGIDVAVINLEMGVRQQVLRSLARLSSINLSRMTNGIPAEYDWPLIVDAISNAAEPAQRMHFDQSPAMTGQQIKQRMKALDRRLRKAGRRLGAVFIDYLQLFDPDKNGNRQGNRTQEISDVSRALKSMALELDIPVVALSQLSRQVESRPDKTPMLSDLRESGSIEQDADIVAMLMRPEYYTKDETPPEWLGKCRVITAKHRDGVPGEDVLRFESQFTRFSNDKREFHAGIGGAA